MIHELPVGVADAWYPLQGRMAPLGRCRSIPCGDFVGVIDVEYSAVGIDPGLPTLW